MARFVYRSGARLPNVQLTWTGADGVALDMTAYTVVVTLVSHADGTVTTPSAVVTRSAAGGVTIAWAAGDLTLDEGDYTMNVRATEIATAKPRDYAPSSPDIIQIVG